MRIYSKTYAIKKCVAYNILYTTNLLVAIIADLLVEINVEYLKKTVLYQLINTDKLLTWVSFMCIQIDCDE